MSVYRVVANNVNHGFCELEPQFASSPATSVATRAARGAGIVELLLPDSDGVAKLGFGTYRWPPQARPLIA